MQRKTDTDTYVRETRNKAGGVTDVSLDKSLTEGSWEQIFDTKTESAPQHREPVAGGAETELPRPSEDPVLHVGQVETGGVLGGGTLLEPRDPNLPADKVNQEDSGRDSRTGKEMRRTDRPRGRAMPSNENLDEPLVISIDVDPMSPGPDYEDPEESNKLIDEEEQSQVAQGGGSPAYTAPGEQTSPGGPSTTKGYYT